MKTLIITEKPSVAINICTTLGIEDKENHKGFIEGDDRIVSWCFGHLIELAEPSAYGEQYKKWTYESLPVLPDTWQYEVKEDTKEQFELLKSLMDRDDVTEIVEATDAGREGEAIFRLVYEMAGCRKPFMRLWISSMEEDAIRDGFNNLKPGSEYDDLYSSARCRQEADWLVGINGTRLFTTLYGKKLKVGRVQTPTLAMLVDREAEIGRFKKEPYYNVHIISDGIDAQTKPIKDKTEAEELSGKCGQKDAEVVSINREDKTIATPKLYDLTSLQRDANRFFGFTAKQTLDYTQSLYEKRLVTYPRTDSRYLSDDMKETAEKVLSCCSTALPFLKIEEGNADYAGILNSKKVSDHHAIIPTTEIGILDQDEIPETEMKILALVAVRLACAISEKHCYTSLKAVLNCEGETFTMSGKTVTENGWKALEDAFRDHYKITSNEKEQTLPDLKEGQIIRSVKSKVVESFTKPPKHYTEDSLLSAMERAGSDEMAEDVERKGLGTPATRADIIEKLVHDGYVRREKKNMIPTDDGIRLITVLPEIVRSAKLTAEWENQLSQVAKGESDPDEFMEGIDKMVRDLVQTYHAVSDEQKALFGSPNRKILGICPRCGSDVALGKYGAYCTKKCGMRFGKAMGKELSEEQIAKLLQGERILVRGIKSKKGKTYDAYLTPKGISDFSYTDKDGQEISGFQFDYHLAFPLKGEGVCEADG